MSQLAGARILITGASGRIGTVTAEHLSASGALVTALSTSVNDSLVADRIFIGDATREEDVAKAMDGADFVVHLAALAHRTAGTPYAVYSTNVVSTFNVLAQAGERGIDRVVVAGSINSYGLPQNDHPLLPAYFPLDTDIPIDLSDWYSLSKRNDENASRMAWRHWGVNVVTLRFPHVNSAAELMNISDRLRSDPESGIREAWSYLDTRDAARSIELSLIARTTGAHAFFLAANSTNSPYRTEDLLQRYAPDVPRLRRFVDREVPIDLTPARELIGFQAAHELDIQTLELPSDA
jgi:nucleoside-diphosphate-sugar epimerase